MRPVPEPPGSNPSSPDTLFETISPAFAAALIAANQLGYSHSKLHHNRKDTIFVFVDPSGAGEELQRRYTAGAFPLVHARVLADARNFLIEESRKVKEGRNAPKH